MEAGKRKRLPESSLSPIAPPEILSAIFGRLDARSLASARLVCREWRAIATPHVRAARLRDGYLERIATLRAYDPPSETRNADEHLIGSLAVWGELLASGSRSGVLRLWNRDGACVREIRTGDKTISAMIAWGPDALAIASGKTVTLWNREGENVRALRGHVSKVFCLTVWDELLASGSLDTIVRLWTREGECARVLSSESSVFCLTTWNGFLVGGCTDGRFAGVAVLWNRAGDVVRCLHGGKTISTSVTTCGDSLATRSRYNEIQLWNRDGVRVRDLECSIGSVWYLKAWRGFLLASSEHSNLTMWNDEGDFVCTLRSDEPDNSVSMLEAWEDRIVVTGSPGDLIVWGVPE